MKLARFLQVFSVMVLLFGGASCTTIDGTGGVSAEADYRPRDQSAPQRYQAQTTQTYPQQQQTYQQPPQQTYQQDRYAQQQPYQQQTYQQQSYQQQSSWNQDYAGQQVGRQTPAYQQQQTYPQDRYAQQQQWSDNRPYQNQAPDVDYTPGSDYAAPRQGQRRSGGYGGTYTVRHGDNLYRIALNYGTTVSQLKNANGLYSTC